MLIYILDSQMRKIGMLRKYTFVQYTDMVRDIGTFTINARIVKENLFLLDKNKKFYVLFDNRIVGKVTNVTRDSDSEYEKVITITGKLALTFFEKRVIAGTIKYKGYTYDYARQLVQTQITNDTTSKRYLKIDVSAGNETEETKLKEICSTIDKQVTGGYVWDEMYAALEQDSLVVFFTPKGGTLVADSVNGVEEWSLLISAGVDRTKGNTEGNVPVVFSQSLSNITRTTYIIDNTYHRNVAYVAGEGEEADRKWFELFSSADAQNASGWDREELWVDARDVQSENEDGSVMSDEEYEQAISERANEKFSENRMSESYEATITNANNQYTYGVDYNKGDWVTVVDDELKISIDVQITEVTKSVEGDREIVDIGFTYGAIKRRDSENSEYVSGKLEQVANDIKYIENKINSGQKILWQGAYWMNASQTISLSEPISKQKNGIVLVFSSFNVDSHEANDFDFLEAFVPKKVVELMPGKGHQFFYNHVAGSFFYGKYLYIYDSEIQGHANNVVSGTGQSGITYMNNLGVLRYVLGV